MEDKVLYKIENINKAYSETPPQCFLVALLLCASFQGEIFYNDEHCITLIGDCFYDKSGKIEVSSILNKRYIPLKEYGFKIEKALMDAAINKHAILE